MNYSFNETGVTLSDGVTIPYTEISHERNKIRFSHSVLVTFEMEKFSFQYILSDTEWESYKEKIKNIDEIYLGQNPDDDSEVVFDFNADEVTDTADQNIVVDFVETYGLSKKNSFFDIIEAIKNI